MANINKIKLSGTTYSIQDLNATKTVELTQAEYDALSVKDPNVFYIITDAEAGDLSNYYTKSETSGATEISTALASKADTATTYTKTETDNAITAATSTKQDTLVSGTNIKTINGETLLGNGNIEIQGGSGGGKAVSAGTNISITTGETADTINCTLPIETIKNPYGISQIYVGDNIYKNNNYEAIVIASKDDSSTGETRVEFAHGAISIGSSNKVFQNGIVIGSDSTAGASNSWSNIAIGHNTVASGTTKTNINNQIKVDDSNQVYIYNKDNTEMICLQDQLGGGGSITIDQSLDSGSTNPVANSAITTAIDSKQNVLGSGYYGGVSSTYTSSSEGTWDFAILKKFVNSGNTAVQNGGDNVYFTRINGKKLVSAFNPIYIPLPNLSLVETSAITTSVTSSSTDSQVPSAKAVNDKLGGLSLVKLSQSEYDSLTTKDSSTLYIING